VEPFRLVFKKGSIATKSTLGGGRGVIYLENLKPFTCLTGGVSPSQQTFEEGKFWEFVAAF
jgi:hypothetical protein